MTYVRTPNEEIVTDAATDVLVNRRRGRFALSLTEAELVLRQGDEVEQIPLASLDGVDASITDNRVRLRFRTVDGARWTLRWYDSASARTGLVLDALKGR